MLKGLVSVLNGSRCFPSDPQASFGSSEASTGRTLLGER